MPETVSLQLVSMYVSVFFAKLFRYARAGGACVKQSPDCLTVHTHIKRSHMAIGAVTMDSCIDELQCEDLLAAGLEYGPACRGGMS